MRTINEKEMTQIQGGTQSGFNVEGFAMAPAGGNSAQTCKYTASSSCGGQHAGCTTCERIHVYEFQQSLYNV